MLCDHDIIQVSALRNFEAIWTMQLFVNVHCLEGEIWVLIPETEEIL